MIKFVTGKPRGGKGLRVIQLIGEELLSGKHRLIVTNLPVKLDELQEWVFQQGGSVLVCQRILLLRAGVRGWRPSEWKEHMRNFFRFRRIDGQPLDLPAEGSELEFPEDTFGILYIIDECHKFWPAQEATQLPKRCPFLLEYLAEHAHFSDDVVFVTQALGQLTTQVRITAQDFELIRNRSKEKFGVFRGPAQFKRYVYLREPKGQLQEPAEVTSFTLAELHGLQDCYDTSTRGGQADKGQRAKGVPWVMVYVFIVAAIVFLWWGATSIPDLIAGQVAITPEARKKLGTEPQTKSQKLTYSTPAPGKPLEIRAIWGDGVLYHALTLDGDHLTFPMVSTKTAPDGTHLAGGVVLRIVKPKSSLPSPAPEAVSGSPQPVASL